MKKLKYKNKTKNTTFETEDWSQKHIFLNNNRAIPLQKYIY